MKSVSFVTIALAGAASLGLAGAASAQPAGGTANWNGFYVGLNTGYNSANTSTSSVATTNQLTGVSAGAGPLTVAPTTYPTARMDYSTPNWAGGGQIGFNKQMGHIVLGLEGDVDDVGGHVNQFSSYALHSTALTTGGGVTINRFTDPSFSSTVRGRVGWAQGPILFYATGGLAIAGMDQSAIYTYSPRTTAAVAAANPGVAYGPYANLGANDSVRTGWTVGGGVEWALNRAVSIGAEYRHMDFGDSTYYLGSNAADSTHELARIGETDDQVLAKVNFRFGNWSF